MPLFLRITSGPTLGEAAQLTGIGASLLVNDESSLWTEDFRVNELGAICRVNCVDTLQLMAWTDGALTKIIVMM